MKEHIEKHIRDNYRTYIYFIIIFITGLIIGIISINNMDIENKEKINNYLISFTTNLKDNVNINYGLLLANSLKKNIQFILILAVLSFSVWRKISNSLLVGYKGFILGYSISSTISIFGIGKGLAFNMSLLMLSELIFIPTVLFTAVYCMNSYYKIINKDYSNKTTDLIRNIIVFTIILFTIVVSSFIKTYLSSNLFVLIRNYF